MNRRADDDNVYINVNDVMDEGQDESAFQQQASLVLSQVLEQSSLNETARDPVSMKDYLIGCGYREGSRIHRSLLKILDDNGVDDVMDLGDFAKGFHSWLQTHGSQHRSMDLVKLSSFIERTCGEAVSLSFTELQNLMDPSSGAGRESHGNDEDKRASDRPKPNPESSERFHTPPLSPRASFDRPTDRPPRRSDIFRPGDLAYNNSEEHRPYGALPSLNLRHDEEYRARQSDVSFLGRAVDLYAPNLTDEAGETESKLRAKMLESAAKTLTTFSGNEDEWMIWRNKTVTAITIAGRRMVLEDNFIARAREAGWDKEKIVEANRFVWILLRSAIVDTRSDMAFSKAPVFDGAQAWYELRRKYEVLGFRVKEKLRRQLESFAPTSRETPEDMLNRFDLLLERYSAFPTAEIWDEERKLRKLWGLCNRFASLKMKVAMIQSEFTSGTRYGERAKYSYVADELIGQWISFGDGDYNSTSIKLTEPDLVDVQPSGDSAVSDPMRDMVVLLSDIAADIKSTSAQSARFLGQGKTGGVDPKSDADSERKAQRNKHISLGICNALDCSTEMRGPPNKRWHLCRACYQKFMRDTGALELPLKDGKFMKKGTVKKGNKFPSVEIAASFFQPWTESECNSQFVYHFHRVGDETTGIEVLSSEVECNPSSPIFLKLDTCAGVGASACAHGFFGQHTPSPYRVSGVNKSKESAFMIKGFQNFAAILKDEVSNSDFIACYGGMLRADTDDMEDTILSTSQMSDHWVDTGGKCGARAHLLDRLSSYFEVAGGRRVKTHRRHGLPGIFAFPVTPSDPRWKTLPKVWISSKSGYVPKDVTDGVILDTPSISVFSNTSEPSPEEVDVAFQHNPVVDEATAGKLLEKTDTALQSSGLVLGRWTRSDPLHIETPAEESILEARFGGYHPLRIQRTIEMVHGGKRVLSAKGKERLASMTGSAYRHVGSHFKRFNPKRKSKMDFEVTTDWSHHINPGDAWCTDIYYSGVATLPYFRVIFDKVVPVGWVYGNTTKDCGDIDCADHARAFYKPFVIFGDAAGEHLGGRMRDWMRDHLIAYHSATPGHQYQHGCEQYISSLANITTYLMLDSQAPVKYTLRAAQHGCHIMATMHITIDGRDTTGLREIFGNDMDLRVLKRWMCLCYVRLDKKERETFGTHGLFGALLGLHGYTYEQWTYEVLIFRTRGIRHTRDVVFMENIMPFRIGRQHLDQPTYIRRTIGTLTPKILSSSSPDRSSEMGAADHEEDITQALSPAWSAKSFVHATSNLAKDPSSWLQLDDTAASPIRVGDTIICPDADTTVISVSPKGPIVQIEGTNETVCIPAFSSFYRDDLCLLHRDRPQRQRKQRVLYNATVLGGTPKRTVQQEVDTGEDLIGKSFYACVDDGDTSPAHYIITGVGDPAAYADIYKGQVPPYLRYLRSDELDDPDAIPRDSTTKEIRGWMQSSQGQDIRVNCAFMFDLDKTLPQAISIDATRVSDCKESTSIDEGVCMVAKKRGKRVTFDPSLGPPVEETPQTGRSSKSVIAAKDVLRERIRGAKVKRRQKRIPRRHVIEILKGKFRPYHVKYGLEVPGAHPFAHARSKGEEYSRTWRQEEEEEIQYLTKLDAFIKGLSLQDIPEGTHVIRTLWAYDAKPHPRARVVADGSQEQDHGNDTYSPVLKLENVKVVLAVIAQEGLDLKCIDIKKAFFKGRLQQPVYIWAPPGFESFSGEVWCVLLPIYGLTMSAKIFYQCVSEFFRMIGFTHFIGDPCLFRRLEGPGVQYPYPDHTDSPDWRRMAPNEDFTPHHVSQLDADAIVALPRPNILEGSPVSVVSHKGKYYFSIGMLYVDDIALASHDVTTLINVFSRRFRISVGENGGKYLGFNMWQDPKTKAIRINFVDYLTRAVEQVAATDPDEVTIYSLVGILQWITSIIFGTHAGEVKSLARRMNKQTAADLKTAHSLLYELYARREQSLHFRPLGDGSHIFSPRQSRDPKVTDASLPRASLVPDTDAVLFTPDEILRADDGINVYDDSDTAPEFQDDVIPPTSQFEVDCWTDSTWCPDLTHGQSDTMTIIRVNGSPVLWDVKRIEGIADSSTRAEYCGAAIGARRLFSIIQTLRFLGIAVHTPRQYIDSTAAKMLALNPKKLGATRHLSIKWHFLRYHVQRKDINLQYCITEDMLADMGTKILPRKTLARFAMIFFNSLSSKWSDNYNHLDHICSPEVYPEWRQRL